MLNQSIIKTIFGSLPLDLWIEIFGMLTIKEAHAISLADPRTFGAFIEDQQVIRFKNVVNDSPLSLFNKQLNFPPFDLGSCDMSLNLVWSLLASSFLVSLQSSR
jgi:hypothetical protein